MANEISTWFKFAIQQMAAESYLDGINLQDPDAVIERLVDGNNNGQIIPPDQFTGKTRFVDLDGVPNANQITGSAQAFVSRYQIIDHHANDATGFSATLMRDMTTGEYALSFRSLEYQDQAQGGDWERDGQGGAAGEIAGAGFALGQLVSMERYYEGLKNSGKLPMGAALNVTGHSLGGHLATVFTELHSADIQQTTIFNGAGRGLIGGVTTVVTETDRIRQLIDAMDAKFVEFDPTGALMSSGSTANVQTLSWYQPAVIQVTGQFQTTGTASLPGGVMRTDGAFAKITQLFGHATSGVDTEVVANSGVHGPVTPILIEGQPLLEGLNQELELQYGNSHSITLIVDSLALQDLFQTVDLALTQVHMEGIFQAASDATAAVIGQTRVAEGDTLELALDGLRKVFLDAATPPTNFNENAGGFGDLTFRNEFYTHLADVQTQLATTFTGQTFQIGSLVGRPTNDLRAAAEAPGPTSLAYRFALKELTPFVVLGADLATTQALYDRQNQTGELSLVNPETGVGELTPQYLTDRAAFLAEKILVNSNASVLFNTTHFHDKVSEYEITPLPGFTRRQMIFGDGTNETIVGGIGADHFYGGSGDDQLNGLAGNDYLEGNRGDDTLNGGSGADTMLGGSGNDTYIVDHAGDVVREYANSGVDTVQSSVTFTLDSQVENLTLTGTSDIHGTGNELANLIAGNDGVNRLEGRDGADTLRGGLGNDILAGGIGNDLLEGGAGFDTYMYNNGDGLDQIEDSDATGRIVFNGSLLQGGVSTDGGATYRSLDGSTGYVLSGGHLIVNGVLTVNANFQSGQFGIQLRDATEADYNNGLETTFWTFGTADDILGGIGSGNHVAHMGGGNDLAIMRLNVGAGNDQLFGEDGNDQLFGGGFHDRLYGGTGNDLLVGDNADPGTVDGNDYLAGEAGNDLLVGGYGDDLLYGGDGIDVLWGDYDAIYPGKMPDGAPQDDFLDGGDGDDELHGGDGNDVLLGGTGNDFLSGEEGDDFADGGAGDDLILGYIGNDSLAGDSGVDTLYGDQGDDVLDGGDENDTLHGGDGADELYGGAGDDQVFGDGLNNPSQLSAASGSDFLDGGAGNDHLEGGIGDDLLFGGEGNDVLFGQGGADSLFGDAGDDELQGGAGNDLLSGDAGNDRLFGQDGADRLYGGGGHDELAGNEGNDNLIGEAGNDVLEGGHGDDVLEGGSGDDTYIFNLGDSHDTITDTVRAGEGNLILFGPGITLDNLVFTPDPTQHTLTIHAGADDSLTLLGFDLNSFQYGVETLAFDNGSQVPLADQLPLPSGLIEGDDSGNVIQSGSGDDVVYAGAGDDTVDAGAGHDTLIGGWGNDVLTGGAGDDTYVFSRGDGTDTIHDTAAAGESNILMLGGGITLDGLHLGLRSGGGLQVETGAPGDAIVFPLFNRFDALGAHAVDQFQFSDGTTRSYAEILGLGFDIVGTENGEFLNGTSVNDRITGLGGSDSIQGHEGSDTIDAGSGDDVVDAGEGNDIVMGGDGNDTLLGREGHNQILGGPGNDTIFGQGGTDFIDGGTGDDEFIGFSGQYTFAFGNGSGHDVISSANGGTYLIQLTPGVVPADVTVGRTGGGLALSLGGGPDTLSIPAFYQNPSFEVHFADGTAWNATTLHSEAGMTQIGTEGDDVLTGFRGFTDELIGLAGNDTYIINDATDSVVEQPDGGRDLVVSAVDYTLSETLEDLTLSGAKFGTGNALDNVLTGDASANVLSGEAGDDILDGGRLGYSFSPPVTINDDTLIGGAGSDTYLYDGNLGGVTTIIDQSANGDMNTLKLSASSFFASADPLQWFRLRLDGSVLVMRMDFPTWSVVEHTREVRFPDFDPADAYGPHAIDVFDFGEGTTTRTYQQLLDLGIDVYGTNQGEVVAGTSAPNRIHGGAGNDTLVGGPRNDVYLFNRGNGADTIIDTAVPGAMNAIQFGEGLNPGDLEFVRGAEILTIDVGSNGDAVILSNYDPTGQAGSSVVESLIFANGMEMSLDELLNFPGGTEGTDTFLGTEASDRYHGKGSDDLIAGGGGNDLLLGGSGEDDLKGEAGDDQLFGGAGDDHLDGGIGDDELGGGYGNDTLTGGAGNDVLDGGAGADTYVFNFGNGQDVIRDTANIGGDNRLFFGPGIILSDLQFSQNYGGQVGVPINGVHVIVDAIYVGNTGDRVDLPNIPDVTPGLRTISFADGLTIDLFDYYAASQIQEDQNLTAVDAGATLIGGAGNDTLHGGVGNNVLIGGGGSNTLIGGAGPNMFYSASAANNTVFFGTGSNVLAIPAGSSSNIVHVLGTPASNKVVFAGGYHTFLPNLTFGSLLIRYGSEGGELHIEGFNPNDAYANPGIGTFEFTDRTLTYQQLIDLGFDVSGTEGDDLLTGSSATDRMKGFGGNDTLSTGLGNDVLEGGIGNDTLVGGSGDDTYLFNLGDGVDTIEDAALTGEGNRIVFGASIQLSDLTLTEDQAARTLTIQVGSGGTDRLILTSFDHTGANGSLVVETLEFAAGSTANLAELVGVPINHAPTVANPLADQTVQEDTPFSIGVPADVFADPDAGDLLTLSASLVDGSALPSWLSFDASTRMFSGTPTNGDVGSLEVKVRATDAGNLSVSDSFSLTVENVNDAPTVADPIVDQSAQTGSAFSFRVPADVFKDVDMGDILTYSATLADGSALPAWLGFDTGTRTFSGTPGSSDAGVLTLKVMVTDSGSLSAADDFTLTVSTADQTLTGTAGNDVLTGGVGNDQLFGLAGNDTLIGGAGNDLLDGGPGADNMQGGSGNDTYVVDNIGDVVAENANEGTDGVQSVITYTLGANVENLTLTGTANIAGTGSAFDNVLIGNNGNNTLTGLAGNDRLDGGSGSDTMIGGTGNDTYVVNQTGDVVTESANQGIDTVESAVTYNLGSNVENLTLTGTANINGTGSSADNVLIGNRGNNQLVGGSGNDTLDGGAGNDMLQGGSGNDRLVGGLGGDALTGGSGNDVLDGGGGLDILDGGSGDDILRGGAGNDNLTGGSGADQFTGGTGNDMLTGGSGNDLYNFARGDGQDTIRDIDSTSGNQDRAVFGATINPLDVIISRQANDLRLAVYGSTDQVTIQNWYAGATNQIETIHAGNGQRLLSTQVDQLIQAMATFTTQTGLTWEQGLAQQPQQVESILAASWQ
ncbi:hypothetical protein W02_36580 [Nitrospira sp. KM1]|uniref:putative Ig domain-containing protein n=1 Tax=Nitrospira sp. KM1 TaxID=1936990 RepID=UPI0013A745F8|nr:putative Ig domain-containing protein [Nitrospira sp. KM1]BCA56518.1 hypothetical protein W02_36580 [Nitrospira sp. KM1]